MLFHNDKNVLVIATGKDTAKNLVTKIRVGRSDLNQHKFTIGLIDSPQCLCLYREESPLHFFYRLLPVFT